MSNVIETLRCLNRKERFAVLQEALGLDRTAPALDRRFRERLSACIGVRVPANAFIAMDYHLDWIHIALHLAEKPHIDSEGPFESPDICKINKNQQDIDLLIAFDGAEPDHPTTHLVLIEAKAYLPWTNDQLDSKSERLSRIFGDDGTRWSDVQPHFVLMTGRRSHRLSTTCKWPGWMTDKNEDPFWLEYDLLCRREVTRCDVDGRPNRKGGHLRLRRVPSQNA